MFSYQNVTVILSSKTKSFDPIHTRPPPTFLFLPYSIVKKQTRKTRHKISLRPTLKPGKKSAIQPISRRFLSEPVRRRFRAAASRSVKRLIR
ncbi:hypothetical protein, partial [Rhizobium sp. AAP43]|uniref:hypothetical protein n=1 Tax=Rhizobium sp. AAP43 TaxID=1523420 RepID=UPI001AEC1245